MGIEDETAVVVSSSALASMDSFLSFFIVWTLQSNVVKYSLSSSMLFLAWIAAAYDAASCEDYDAGAAMVVVFSCSSISSVDLPLRHLSEFKEVGERRGKPSESISTIDPPAVGVGVAFTVAEDAW